MRVLITGGTGVLGRELTSRLRDHAEVRILSRSHRSEQGFVQGDLETGEGLAEATAGVDVIAHLASAADYRRPQRDVKQTRRLVATLTSARPHLVYASIVGVDKVPIGFFRAKLESERVIEASGMPWTVVRATEFHDLILRYLRPMAKGPVAVVPRRAILQPVEVGEVADRLAELVIGPPVGRARDLGGPQVETMEELMRTYLEVAGRRRRVLAIPLPGRLGAMAGVGGSMVVADGDRGRLTFAEHLRARVATDGSISHRYHD
ncbi:SDR family oxidoreductase [Phytoactinopolyspora limicola]|uniref:SDR family oxidoreductase n=1 Tax=Phytoactinopolyspora limicola TaxID=2715536 RepID=UPI0014093F35|nr:SDR family oxidoreductase [Phytoactinopolyspora limicola]